MDTMTYHSRQTVDQSLIDAYSSMKQNQQFVDGLLLAGGSSIRVHLVLVASRSAYLKQMFTYDASKNEFEFDDITFGGLSTVVDFVYTGRVKLAANNVSEVLEAALYMEMWELVGFCLDYSRYRPLLWPYQINMAEKYGEVAKPLRDSVIANATCHQLCDLMASDSLSFPSEQGVFKLALDWLTANRSAWLQKGKVRLEEVTVHMLSMVRYGLLADMASFAQQVEALEGNERALAVGYKYHQCRQQQPLVKSYINCVRNNSPKLLILGGVDGEGKTYRSTLLASLRPELGQFDTSGVLPTPCVQSGVVAFNGFVFIAGGQKCSDGRGNSACKSMYRLDTRHNRWVQGADMASERSFFPLVCLGGAWLLAVGGVKNNYTLREVEAYSIAKNTWVTFTPLPQAISGHAGVVINGTMYVCGGIDLDARVVDTMYRLEQASWCQLGRMHTARTGHTMVQHGTNLLVCGGSTREERGGWRHVMTMEKYHALNGQWTELAPPPISMSYATACVSDDRMYVIGGYKDLTTLQSIFEYNIRSDRWVGDKYQLPRALAKAMCVVVEPMTLDHLAHPSPCRTCHYLERDDNNQGPQEFYPGPGVHHPGHRGHVVETEDSELRGLGFVCEGDPNPLTDVVPQRTTIQTVPKQLPRVDLSRESNGQRLEVDSRNPSSVAGPGPKRPSAASKFKNKIGTLSNLFQRPRKLSDSTPTGTATAVKSPHTSQSSGSIALTTNTTSDWSLPHSRPVTIPPVVPDSVSRNDNDLNLQGPSGPLGQPGTTSLPSFPHSCGTSNFPQSVCDETLCTCTGLDIQFDLPLTTPPIGDVQHLLSPHLGVTLADRPVTPPRDNSSSMTELKELVTMPTRGEQNGHGDTEAQL